MAGRRCLACSRCSPAALADTPLPADPARPAPPGPRPLLPQTIARRIPQAAYFTTLAIRFANNVVGGENFIDMARWAGVQ